MCQVNLRLRIEPVFIYFDANERPLPKENIADVAIDCQVERLAINDCTSKRAISQKLIHFLAPAAGKNSTASILRTTRGDRFWIQILLIFI